MKLPKTYPGGARIGQLEEDGVVRTVRSKRLFRYYGLTDGPSEVATFESEVAAKLGTSHALAVSSGTAALTAGLAALGVGPGDEVIVPAYTWISTASAVLTLGAVPVIAEIDASLTMDPTDLENVITKQTKAIIPVHMRGAAADLDPILEIAGRHHVPVLEDTAQAMGGAYHGVPLGTLGAIGAFSLQFNKTITSGEGGIVTSNDALLWQRANMYHDVMATLRGIGPLEVEAIVAQNLRMSELQGAVARVQLNRLDGIVVDGQRIQRTVIAGVSDALRAADVTVRPTADPDGDIGVCIVLQGSDAGRALQLMHAAVAEGLPAHRLYDAANRDFHVAAHWDPIVNRRWWSRISPWDLHEGKVAYDDSRWGRSLDILGRSVHVELSPELDDNQIDFVVQGLNNALRKL